MSNKPEKWSKEWWITPNPANKPWAIFLMTVFIIGVILLFVW